MAIRVHPLRIVRKSQGLSRTKFARLFGVSASWIEKIEIGRSELNDELAEAIMIRYGLSAVSLKVKPGADRWTKPKSIYGRVLPNAGAVANQIERWKLASEFVNDSADGALMALVYRLRILIRAATAKNCAAAAILSLEGWINKTIEDLRLRFEIRKSANFDYDNWLPVMQGPLRLGDIVSVWEEFNSPEFATARGFFAKVELAGRLRGDPVRTRKARIFPRR